ncbi:hypothetical protein BDZ91DRAFT_132190 [Kalaharituber pfeilii]|nr:hypothetical protein BDZ91DRAFT_132190 [Kalaharituber pfeilii]
MRSQAHVALQQQYHQHHQHHQHHHQTSPHYSSSPMLPGLSELGLVVGAQGGNDRSPPSARGNTLHSFSPQSPPRPQQSSKKEPWYERSSVAIPMVESLPYQQPMNKLVASQNGGASVGPNRYQRQQQPQQQQQNQYQSHVGGGNYPNPSLSPLVKQPSSPLQQHDQVQHRHPVAVQWWNNEDGPWSPVSTRNQVSASNHRDSTDGPRGLKRSSAAGSASSPGRKDSSGPPPAGNGIINENSHAESRRRASAGTVSAPEFHERSASCPSLLQHIGMPVAQCPGDLQTPSRSTAAGGAQNSQYHNLPGMEHDPVPGGLTPSPQTNVRFPPPASANQRSVDGCNTYNHSNGVRSNSTGDVLAWMSSPRSDSKSTTSGHTMGTNQPLPETGDSDTIPSELLTPTSRIWKGHPNSSSPPYGINNHINDNDSNSNMRNMDYEYVQQSPTPGASMASSTTSSETTTTRISDGGSVPKRRSISAAKREYRCTKKEGCDAVFTCNSLRKKHEMKHTKPFTCLQRSCPKHKVGFTTSNDLRRHMKALHGVDGSVDPEVIAAVDAVGGWRCKYCPTVEPSNGIGHGHPAKGFFSTRKDNFRNHIKRIHSSLRRENETMDEFFRR